MARWSISLSLTKKQKKKRVKVIISHVGKSCLIRLAFLQGLRICSHLCHVDPGSLDIKKQTAKKSNFLESDESESRRGPDQCQCWMHLK
jgi:hypothetical protein